METRTIFFIGKPGCGKGTQAKLLSERTGWPVLGSGKLFREIATHETPVGKKVKAEIDSGLLAPPWFAMYLYLDSLFSVSDVQSVIFEGFGRKVEETKLIVDSLLWLDRPFSILNIAISDEEMLQRLNIRKQDSGRADDLAIEERLKEYNLYTKDAIEVFRRENVLVDINGEQTREAIAADIAKALDLP
jgi:adenylate kinase